jgi:DNA-binding LytR/AlgR family response regulator
MQKQKILIVEDELVVAQHIQTTLELLGYEITGVASTVENAQTLVRSSLPDLVLMAIHFNGETSGLELATFLRKEYALPIVYLTPYSDFNTLSKVYITQPYGFIVKPFKTADVQAGLELAWFAITKEREKETLQKSITLEKDKLQDFIFIKSGGKLVKVQLSAIFYIEALKDYVVIHTQDLKYTIHSTMKEIERKLGSFDFIRVHRSFIVRLDKIASIEFSNLQLDQDKKTIPIGGSYREELAAKIRIM